MSSLSVFKEGLLKLSRTAVKRARQDLQFSRSTTKGALLQFSRTTIEALLQFSMTTIKGVLLQLSSKDYYKMNTLTVFTAYYQRSPLTVFEDYLLII